MGLVLVGVVLPTRTCLGYREGAEVLGRQDGRYRLSKPRLLYFSAVWCTSCKAASRVVDTLGDDFDVERVDIDIAAPLVNKYAIRAAPTVVVLKDGVEVTRQSGRVDAGRLREYI